MPDHHDRSHLTDLDAPSATPSATSLAVQVGDRVRSFDYAHIGLRAREGPSACFIEGVVEGIGRYGIGHAGEQYRIRVTRQVHGGVELADFVDYVYPPVNGTPILGANRVTAGVERLDDSGPTA